MKRILTSTLLAACACVQLHAREAEIPTSAKASHKLVDKIVARVNGSNIMLSSLQEPLISRMGTSYISAEVLASKDVQAYRAGLEQAIDEQLLLIRAIDRKLMPTPAEVEKQMVSYKAQMKMAHLNDKEFEKELIKEGLTIEKYRVQLQKFLGIERLRQTEASERLVVSMKDKRAYYEKNMEKVDEIYSIKVANFSHVQLGTEQQPGKRELLARADLAWIDFSDLKRSDIAEHLSPVFSLRKGEVSEPIKQGNSYQLVMLVDKTDTRYKSFEEQEVQIEKELVEQKTEVFLKELVTDLRSDAVIVYL